jgi:hypothetical protein
MPLAGFEPVTLATKRLQTYALDRAATGIGQGYEYRIHIFVATYCFVPSFRKAEFCGVPWRDIVKVGYAVGKKRLRNTDLGYIASNKRVINER